MIPNSEFKYIFGIGQNWHWRDICEKINNESKSRRHLLLRYIINRYLQDKKHTVTERHDEITCFQVHGALIYGAVEYEELIRIQIRPTHDMKIYVFYTGDPQHVRKYNFNSGSIGDHIFTYVTDSVSELCYRKIEQREYQARVLRTCIASRGGVVIMPFASGKTYIQTQIAKKYPGTVIFVHNTVVANQTKKLLQSLKICARVVLHGEKITDANCVIYDDFNATVPDLCECDRTFYFTAVAQTLPPKCNIICQIAPAEIREYIADYVVRCYPRAGYEYLKYHESHSYISCDEKYKRKLQEYMIEIGSDICVYYITNKSPENYLRLVIQEYKQRGGILCSNNLNTGISVGEINRVFIVNPAQESDILQVIGRGLRDPKRVCELHFIYRDLSELKHHFDMICKYDPEFAKKMPVQDVDVRGKFVDFLEYGVLQQMAKCCGIRANIKKDEIVREIKAKNINSVVDCLNTDVLLILLKMFKNRECELENEIHAKHIGVCLYDVVLLRNILKAKIIQKHDISDFLKNMPYTQVAQFCKKYHVPHKQYMEYFRVFDVDFNDYDLPDLLQIAVSINVAGDMQKYEYALVFNKRFKKIELNI